jgi:hypothetical protein
MPQILRVNSFLTPSELSVQDYVDVGLQNLFVHWDRKCYQPALASRILELGTGLRRVAASGPVSFTLKKFMAVSRYNQLSFKM